MSFNFGFKVDRHNIEEHANGWAVPIEITNRSTVAVKGMFYEIYWADGKEPKRGEIPVFGSGESVKSEIWFDQHPSSIELNLRVETYSL